MRLTLTFIGIAVLAALAAAWPFQSSSVEAGTARKMEVSELLDASDLAFQGTVLTKQVVLGAHNLIETEFVFQVTKTFWGAELKTRVVKLPGGVLPDGRGLVLAGMPAMATGEEVLIFLSASSGGGLRMPVGLAQGKFSVQRLLNGSVRLVNNAQSLQLSNPVTGQIEQAPAFSVHNYAQVQAEIMVAASARRARIAAGEEDAIRGE